MKKTKIVIMGIIAIIGWIIFRDYKEIKKTNHYQNWLYWCKECQQTSKFKKILVLFKIIYPPSFMMTVSDLNLKHYEKEVF